ncbi:phage tail assembly protein [Photobacterium sp. WH24]|uniref:phage tail assembly protein n=1 Tax=Photobacterium sp. WH24 TaxID=2827237 RepID=UPI001C443D3F|nr:phage tail assembly protein [Photobacterium sp. WH24]MBV7262560.1 phage tail assembly protein [Photobacterium sp. WH24]
MAKMEFELEHGLPFGRGKDAEMQYDVTLRELTTKDVIDARTAAEKVIFVPDPETHTEKAITVVSEVNMGLELLRRQVARIGDIQGPLTMKQIHQLHLDDFQLLNLNAEKLDAAVEVAAKRGRLERPGTTD